MLLASRNDGVSDDYPRSIACWPSGNGNVELIHEFDVNIEEDRNWFECLWAVLEPDPMPTIAEYERNYKPPKRKSSPPYRGTEPGLPAISGGREVVRLDNWIQLKRRECYILRVRNNEEDKWALLGTIRGGAVYVVNNGNMPEVGPIRIQIRERADQVLDADSEEIADVSCDAMEAIRNLRDNAVHLGKDLFYR